MFIYSSVNSNINHLNAIFNVCKNKSLDDVYIHAFTDGRDTDPKSGLGFIKDLESHLHKIVGKIATISGRYYAMDRDKRWERIKLAYDVLVNGKGDRAASASEAIENSYQKKVTDEFIKP